VALVVEMSAAADTIEEMTAIPLHRGVVATTEIVSRAIFLPATSGAVVTSRSLLATSGRPILP